MSLPRVNNVFKKLEKKQVELTADFIDEYKNVNNENKSYIIRQGILILIEYIIN